MRRALAGLAVSGAALLVACGGGGEKPTSTTTAATTAPAATSAVVSATATTVPATRAAVPSPTPPAAPPPANTEIPPPPPPPPPPPVEPPPPSGVTLTVVAVNLLFDVRSLSAAAGSITIIFDNQDTTDTHNIHFFSKAGSIGMTEIMPGPATDILPLGTLAPGAYFYKCDVHPQTMTGTLTVS